ncbi:methyl-accepting chemotaxis protein [Ekhidna sp.]
MRILTNIKNLSLKFKLGLIPSFFALLFLASFIIIFNSQINQKADAEIVNVAGRQRMLSQKIAYIAERIVRGEEGLKDEFLNTIALCDKSLEVLEKGGVAPSMNGITIPAINDTLMKELVAAKSLWVDYKANSESLVQGAHTNILFIEQNSGLMLATFNDLVQSFVKLNAEKQESQNSLLLTLLVINLVIAGLVIFVVNDAITVPIIRITNQLKELAKGKTGKKLGSRSQDEVGQAITNLNELSGALHKISHFAKEISVGGLDTEYELLSDDDRIGKSLIQMRNNIRQIVLETNQVLHDVVQNGDLQTRMHAEDKQGIWRELGLSINQMLDTIADPVEQIKGIFGKMADGDLSVTYSGRAVGEIEELTSNLNNAISKLSLLVRSLSGEASNIESTSVEMLQAGEEISRSSDEIATAVGQISSGAQVQMREIDESSSLLEDMSRSFKSSSNNVSEIKSLASDNKELSEKGSAEMSKIISLNEEVLMAFGQSNAAIEQLNNRNDQINQIVSVITEISAQTSLLALNASIEAAHAGDQGRGFAVVAEEIKRLAHDSQVSSKEIEKLVGDIQRDIKGTMEAFNTMNDQISNSVDAGKEAFKVISDISSSANRTFDYSDQIFGIMEEQTKRIGSLLSKSESVVSVAEESAAGTEQVAASSEEVSSAMKLYVNKFDELSQIASKLRSQADQFVLRELEEVSEDEDDNELVYQS